MNFSNHNKPVLCTEHIANFIGNVRDSQGRFIARLDWMKIPRILKGEWPRVHPQYIINHTSMIQLKGSDYVIIDNEWDEEGVYQTGIYNPRFPPFIIDLRIGSGQGDLFYIFRDILRDIIENTPVIFQNAVADIPKMEERYSIGYDSYHFIHDTLYMHSCLWSELPHNLAFMGSCYSDYNKLKHLGPGSYEYLVGDLVDTYCVYREMSRELSGDEGSKYVYENLMLPLIPIILDARRRGIRVDNSIVLSKDKELSRNIRFANGLSYLYCKYPINLDSPKQLIWYLCEVEDVHTRAGVSRSRTRKGHISFSLDKITELREAFLPLDRTREETPEYILERIEEGAHPLLEARALYVGSRKLHSSFIKPLMEGD